MKGNTAYKKAFIVGILFVLVACTLLFSTSIFFNRSGNLQTSTDKAQTSNYPFDGLQIMKKAVEMTKGTNRYDCSGFVAAVIADLSGVNVSKLTNIGTSGWQSGSFTFQHSNGITYGIGSPIARRDGVKGKSTSWTDFLGRENLSKLRAGDIICGEGHMFIYIGHFESTDNASFPYTNNKDMGQQKMLEYLASQGIKTDGLNINNNASRGNYCTNYWFVEGNVDGNGNYIPTIRNYSWAIPESSWYQEWSNNMNNIKVYRFSPGTRKYHAYVGKKSSSDPEGPYIGGVTFSIKKPGETKSSDYTITENNRFNFTGEVTMSSTGSDNYVIGEKSAPSGYKLRGGTYGFNVIKTIKNGYYAIDHIKYYSGANDTYKQANIGIGETWWILEDRTAKKDGVTDEEKKKAIGSIELAADGGAFQFIELNEPSGGYHMYVSKQDYDTGNLLEGAEYSIKQIIDNVDVGTSPYTDGNSKVITKADKEAYVFWEKDKNVITKKTNKNNYTEVAIKNAGSDRYEIKEVKAPNGYVIGNSTPIVLQLNKVMRADNSGFEIDSIEIYGRPETKVTAPADSSQAAWLRIDYDGNITTDENNYWFAADFHRGTSSAIQVRFKDKKAEYSMDIDKVSSEDGSYLKYAIFKVKYYKDTKVENYDGQLYHNYGSENDMDMNCIETATIHNFTEESVSSYGSVEIPVSEDYNLKSLSTGGSITVDENGNNIDNSKSNPPITMSVTSGDVRDIMQISEVLAPETYKKIVNSPINLAIHKSNNNTYLADSEGNYKIFAIELLDSNGRSTGENGYTISENEILKIDGNGNIVDSNPVITISFSGSKISVKWKNEPIKSEYDVKIKKINKTLKNQAIQGVKFRVNGSETEPTGVDGLTYAKENVTISRYNVNEVDEYRITEVNLGTNQGLIKFVGELQVYVSKGYNSDKDLYEVTNVSFANNSDIKTKEIALENGDIATATVELVNGVVEITIPNEIEGNYNLKIGKKSAKNNEYIGNKDSGYAISDDDYLADAQFTVEQYLNVDKRVQNNANYLTEEHKTDTVEGITSLENEPTQVVFKDGANVNINNVVLIYI